MKYFCLLLFFLLSLSCERADPLENKAINSIGGLQKNYNYEEYGNFYNYNFYVDNLNTDDSSGAFIQPLALPNSRIALVTTDGNIMRVFEKKIEWSEKLDNSHLPASSLVCDRNGNFYLLSIAQALVSLKNSGKFRWKIDLYDNIKPLTIFSELIIDDKAIYCGDNNGNLFKIDFDGKILWKKTFPLSISRTLSMTTSGKIAITLTNDEFGKSDRLILIDSRGNIIFEKHLDRMRLFRSPSITNNNKFILIAVQQTENIRKNLILCLDSTGKEIWTKNIDLFPRYTSIDEDGNIYVVAFDSGLGEPLSGVYCLDKDGGLKWKLYFDVQIKTPLLISQNKLSFLGIKKQLTAMFFLKKDGTIFNHISLNDAPLINSIPTVRTDGVICFAAINKPAIIRIDDTFLNKLLPW